MKLYDLVCLKKSLSENFVTDDVVASIQRLRDQITNTQFQVESMAPEYQEHINYLVQYYNDLIAQAEMPAAKNQAEIKSIEARITELSHKLYSDSYDLEEHDGGFDNVKNNRTLTFDDEIRSIIESRTNLYCRWEYPTLEIGCRDGEWTQRLTASDPLYIMDKYPEFLKITDQQFPPEYQRRLRKYALDYSFAQLPKNQFAFVFSWNHFNYISLDTLTQALKNLKDVLRPGGVFMFSFNDGDTPAGAGLAENFGQTYVPKSILIPTALSMGYELLNEGHNGVNISWLELRKPGTLRTVKAHQVMGKILSRTP